MVNIQEIIPVGKDKRITAKRITELTGLDGAHIRAEINRLRSEFVPIASDQRGYYIAETPDDLSGTIAHINHRIHKMIAAREGLRRAIEKMQEEERKVI